MSRCTERNKRKAAIYRKAALAMERQGDKPNPDGLSCSYGYACNAIETVQGRDFTERRDSSASKIFKTTFSPGWANEFGFFGPLENAQNRNRRVLALCFMAAMVEDGDV